MRGYSSRNKKLRKIYTVTAVFTGIILLGVLLPRIFSFVGYAVLTPVHHVSHWLQTSEQLIPALLRDRQELTDQISQLENDLAVAKGNSVTFRRMQDENIRLRNLLNVSEGKRTVARVTAWPDALPYDILIIDQGSLSGITERALVYAGRDQLIGSVSEVRRNYAIVELFTTPGIEMTGFISGPDVVVAVEGMGSGVARARVPQGVPLQIGDLVYVPGIEPGLFGKIDYIENQPSQPEQFAYITLQTSLRSLYEVAVTEAKVEIASTETIRHGVDSIINQRLLVEAAHTRSFENVATSSATTTEAVSEE